jgi:hypothetical protein
MHKAIAKQLRLDERQQRQLKIELEEISWLYSDSVWKKALACYGYSILGSLIILGPFYLFLLLLVNAVT